MTSPISQRLSQNLPQNREEAASSVQERRPEQATSITAKALQKNLQLCLGERYKKHPFLLESALKVVKQWKGIHYIPFYQVAFFSLYQSMTELEALGQKISWRDEFFSFYNSYVGEQMLVGYLIRLFTFPHPTLSLPEGPVRMYGKKCQPQEEVFLGKVSSILASVPSEKPMAQKLVQDIQQIITLLHEGGSGDDSFHLLSVEKRAFSSLSLSEKATSSGIDFPLFVLFPTQSIPHFTLDNSKIKTLLSFAQDLSLFYKMESSIQTEIENFRSSWNKRDIPSCQKIYHELSKRLTRQNLVKPPKEWNKDSIEEYIKRDNSIAQQILYRIISILDLSITALEEEKKANNPGYISREEFLVEANKSYDKIDANYRKYRSTRGSDQIFQFVDKVMNRTVNTRQLVIHFMTDLFQLKKHATKNKMHILCKELLKKNTHRPKAKIESIQEIIEIFNKSFHELRKETLSFAKKELSGIQNDFSEKKRTLITTLYEASEYYTQGMLLIYYLLRIGLFELGTDPTTIEIHDQELANDPRLEGLYQFLLAFKEIKDIEPTKVVKTKRKSKKKKKKRSKTKEAKPETPPQSGGLTREEENVFRLHSLQLTEQTSLNSNEPEKTEEKVERNENQPAMADERKTENEKAPNKDLDPSVQDVVEKLRKPNQKLRDIWKLLETVVPHVSTSKHRKYELPGGGHLSVPNHPGQEISLGVQRTLSRQLEEAFRQTNQSQKK